MLDHMEILYQRKGNRTNDAAEDRVARMYHHGDKGLMDLRLSHSPYSGLGSTALGDCILDSCEATETHERRKRQFLATYPEAKVIDKLLLFDNWQEYVYVYTQAAYPDLHLREEVVKQCAELGLIDQDHDALSFKKEEILGLIDRAFSMVEANYCIPVDNYTQTVTSCGVSCIMTLAGRNGLPQDQDTEIALWQRAGAPYNFPGGMGSIARDLGLKVVYVLDRDQHFIEGEYPIDDISHNPRTARIVGQYIELYNDATRKGMNTVHAKCNFEDIVEGLRCGWFGIIGTHMPNDPHTLHWILAHGYHMSASGETHLKIADPLGRFNTMTKQQMEQLADTYMGRRIMFVHKDSQMVS
jgi:hypothetical protein